MIVRIVVLFKPPADVVQRLRHFAEPGYPVVAVYNQADGAVVDRIRTDTPVTVVPLVDNTGLAHALNLGIARAQAMGATYVSLYDQDSVPAPARYQG